MSEKVCNLDHYREDLPGETVFENKHICIKKQDDYVYFYVNVPVEGVCVYFRYDKDTAIEFSEKIIESLKG